MKTVQLLSSRLASLRGNRALLQAVVLTAGRGASVILQVITIRTFTTLIAPDEVGRYYLLLAAQTWAMLLLFAPPSMFFFRGFVEWRQRNLHLRALAILFVYVAAIALVSLPIFWIAIHFGFVSSSSALFTALILVVWLIAMVGVNIIVTALNLIEQRGASVIITTAGALLALAAAVGGVFFFGHRSAEIWIAGLATGNALATLSGAIWLLRRAAPTDGDRESFPLRATLVAVWLFSWPIAIITGLSWIQSQGYRRILLITAGEAGVGQFAVAYAVAATIAGAVDTILQQWILPPFFHRVSGEKNEQRIDETWQDYFAAVLMLLIPLAAFMSAASPFLLGIVVGPAFQLHPMLPVWAGLAESFRVINGLLYLGGIARRNTREMVLPHVPGAIAVLLLLYPASVFFGLHGAGAAIMVSYLVLVTTMWLTVQRRIFSKVKARELARALAIALAIVIICGVAGLAGWRAHLPTATLTVALAGIVLLAGALVSLPRLLALTQPSGHDVPVEPMEEVPCL